MSTKTDSTNELDAFQQFMNDRHGGTLNGSTLDEAVEEFRQYRQQLTKLREKLNRSEQSATEEGTHTMSEQRIQKTFKRLDAQLEKDGITN